MKLLIVDCKDPMMWYRDLIGQEFPLVARFDDCYLSREPSGYTNIVHLEDARVVYNDNLKQSRTTQ